MPPPVSATSRSHARPDSSAGTNLVTAERSDGPILRWLRTRSDRVSRKLTEEQCTLLAQKPPEASIAPRPETSAVILHHSATPDGSVSLFRVLHRAVFGWDDVGYHFVIGNGSFSPDGAVEEGRPRRRQAPTQGASTRRASGYASWATSAIPCPRPARCPPSPTCYQNCCASTAWGPRPYCCTAKYRAA